MFSKNVKMFLMLIIAGLGLNTSVSCAEEPSVAPVNMADLPINVAAQEQKTAAVASSQATGALVSPSQAQAVAPSTVQSGAQLAENNAQASAPKVAPAQAQAKADTQAKGDDFNLDLKMKAINPPAVTATSQTFEVAAAKNDDSANNQASIDEDIPQSVQYQANPVENLGNSVLSQMDSDLFTQMSEIEKSTTLLTLELRREKIRNEIEAQKAIRRKNATDFEKQQAEEQLKNLERKKQIEAQVLKEQQLLVDKEKVFEVLKQRKLLNAYMNQMLLTQQEWLKEKESLYAQLAAAEQEKKELVELFKQKIEKVLEASAKNIQTAEVAKANFERIVKGLKARNEQLRKRIEADAQIIKNAKSNMYLKAQSLEELKDRNTAALSAIQAAAATATTAQPLVDVNEDEEETSQKKLSAEYAILGIAGRSGVMSIDLIDSKGQTLSLKVGSPLPTGHIVSEIGSDYAKFNKDGHDDYLYVGKTIDGMVPTLGLLDTKAK